MMQVGGEGGCDGVAELEVVVVVEVVVVKFVAELGLVVVQWLWCGRGNNVRLIFFIVNITFVLTNIQSIPTFWAFRKKVVNALLETISGT